MLFRSEEIVLCADKTPSTGGPSFVIDLGTTDPFLTKLAYELQATKPMLHPDILAGAASDQEREDLKGFLIGLVGVQKMDAKTVCLEAIIPKTVIAFQVPAWDEMLTLTKYCQKHLPSSSVQGKELWVVNKQKQVRKASEVLLSAEFKPAADWEKHQRYVPGTDFLNADYISDSTEADLRTWRSFLQDRKSVV